MYSNKLKDSDLYNLAANEVAHTFEAVSGVAKVEVHGSGDYIMSIELDPKKLTTYGLTALDVIHAVERQNIEKPAGKIVNNDREYIVTTVADVQSPEEFENIPIVTKKKKVIKLRDVANVKLDNKNKDSISRFNGEKVVVLAVVGQSAANPMQIAAGIRAKLEEISHQLPEGTKCVVAYDTTTFMEKSLAEVKRTIFEAVLLVVIVVLFFLRSFRAAMVPVITVPISLIGALFIMYLCDFTLNNMTLMSMVLAIGLVVDDAIVILENIYKHLEMGKSSVKAAIDGTKEVSFAVIAMTLTLCAVYAPVALAQGVTGKYLKEFSVSLSGAVLLSGFVALTLSPMMCSRLLSAHDDMSMKKWYTNWWYKVKKVIDFSGFLSRTEEVYENVLRYTIYNKRKLTIIIALICSAFGFLVYLSLPSEYMPYQDKGVFYYDGHSPHTSTLQYTQRYVEAIDKVIADIPEIESRYFSITNPTFEGSGTLKDRSGRTTDDIIAEIEEKMKAVAGVDVNVSSGHGGSDDGTRAVTFVIRGNKSHRELRDIGSNLVRELYASLIVQGVKTSAKNEAEDYVVEIKKDKASALNIDAIAIAELIDGLIRGRKAGTFKKDNKVFDVKVEVQGDFKKTIDQLSDFYVKAYMDREEQLLIPLAELISVYARSGPVVIERYHMTRSHMILALLKPGLSIGEAVVVIRDIAKRTLPDDVFLEFVGETKRFLHESNTMMMIFFLAISFIYLVMAAQFESWRDPFIIMLTVPLALVGGVLALSCTSGSSVNIFSNMGFLTLVGLITKHGILIVDFSNKLVAAGKDIKDAVIEASRRRLRPILMTTLAMVLGALPLAAARGAGCEIRIPLGVVIVGGLSLGTIFTLFVLPVLYTYIASAKKRKSPEKQLEGLV
jgi:multidrug efflux pump